MGVHICKYTKRHWVVLLNGRNVCKLYLNTTVKKKRTLEFGHRRTFETTASNSVPRDEGSEARKGRDLPRVTRGFLLPGARRKGVGVCGGFTLKVKGRGVPGGQDWWVPVGWNIWQALCRPLAPSLWYFKQSRVFHLCQDERQEGATWTSLYREGGCVPSMSNDPLILRGLCA